MRLKRGTQWGATSLLLCLILWGLLSITCSEAPFQPDDENLKDYRAWFRDVVHKDKLFWFHTATGEVDSASIEWDISDNPTVSHDGRLIYVPTEGAVKVLETDSFSTVGEIPHHVKRAVAVSPNGQYLALFGDSTWIVRTSDYSTIFVYPARLFGGCFSADGQTLYTADGMIRRFSLADPEQITHDTLRKSGGVRQVMPTPDETRLAVYFVLAPYVWAFGVYDIALDSILNYDMQVPGNGMFAMTPDGKQAFYGNPGTMMPVQLPTSDLTVYDVESARMVKRMNLEGLIENIYPPEFYIGELVISPDGRWVIGNRGFINQGFDVFQWDIREERIENFWQGPGTFVLGLSIQLVE